MSTHRRRLGYALKGIEGRLRGFAEHCDRVFPGQAITTAHAVEWAKSNYCGAPRHAPPVSRSSVLLPFTAPISIRGLKYRSRIFSAKRLREPARIFFSDAEIVRLMRRARRLKDAYSPLRPYTYETLIGLLACTGMRPCEALRLKVTDFDPGEWHHSSASTEDQPGARIAAALDGGHRAAGLLAEADGSYVPWATISSLAPSGADSAGPTATESCTSSSAAFGVTASAARFGLRPPAHLRDPAHRQVEQRRGPRGPSTPASYPLPRPRAVHAHLVVRFQPERRLAGGRQAI